MFSAAALINEYKRPLVMGILNITPDSFFDGGEAVDVHSAVKKARELTNAGADIIDIGACSTAPGKPLAGEDSELERLKAILPAVAEAIRIPVSVDTFRPSAACFALKNGAVMVNDESGAYIPEMAAAVKEYRAGWVFMHTGSRTSDESGDYPDGVISAIKGWFNSMKVRALADGIENECLVYDYGIGFGKTRNEDMELLANTAEFSEFAPLLVGASRKRVIGEMTGEDSAQNRLFGTVAAEALTAFSGAGIIRAHDVKAARDAVMVAADLKRLKLQR